MNKLNLQSIDSSWLPLVKQALSRLETDYLRSLETDDAWLPGPQNIFNAFRLPLSATRFILFGESPYPRKASATGYAFWDGAVKQLWAETGLDKKVNRATSLRNMIKMLLLARGDLTPADTSQAAIAQIDKTGLVATIDELFTNFLKSGFLLLNATLVLSKNGVKKDAKNWYAFSASILEALCRIKPDIELVLWGHIAKEISVLPAAACFKHFSSEHPYNHSFMSNEKVLDYFRPFDLLKRRNGKANHVQL